MVSHSAWAASALMKLAMMPGADMMEAAKMTGMTPAELTLIGRKLARAIGEVDPPRPACWTGIFRLANSMMTTKPTMKTIAMM